MLDVLLYSIEIITVLRNLRTRVPYNMNITELASNRFTTKAYDASRPLTEQQIADVLSLLQNSPSTLNLQGWHFHVITTEAGRDKSQDENAKQIEAMPNADCCATQCENKSTKYINKMQKNSHGLSAHSRLGSTIKDGSQRDRQMICHNGHGKKRFPCLEGRKRYWREKTEASCINASLGLTPVYNANCSNACSAIT